MVAQVEELSLIIHQMAATTMEQSVVSDQISSDIEAVSEIVKVTSAGAEQIALASRDIAQHASDLHPLQKSSRYTKKTLILRMIQFQNPGFLKIK